MMTLINGVMTGVLLLIFLGICFWAYSRHNKETFAAMSRLPLEESSSPVAGDKE